MRQTILTPVHIDLGAKMAEFAGYTMPIVYSSIKEEHLAVRNKVGVFDVSHMGEFIFKGDKALDLLQRVTTNDVAQLQPGDAQYTCMTNEQGGIVDDLLVYHLEDGNYMLVVNAANIQKDWDWIEKHNHEGVESHNISDKTSLLAVQGPRAAEALQSLTDIKLDALKYYTFTKGTFAGFEKVLISATGYTGAGGFEIYFDSEKAKEIWAAIFAAGGSCGIVPVGLAARDTLRLEMGFCLYGNDIDDTTNPYAAGLGWITKPKAKDFVGKEPVLEQKKKGFAERLCGFEMIERGIARQGYAIVDKEGTTIGRVTSGTQSPLMNKAIGLGYVEVAHKAPGTEIFIAIRNKHVKAKITKPPFIQTQK